MPDPITIVFMGTPQFAVPSLDRLAAHGFSIVAVYTQPDRPSGRSGAPAPGPVKQAALRLGLPVTQPRSLRRAEEIGHLQALQPDLIALAAYGLILPQAVLDIPRFGGLNVHPSLLPRHRGPAPVVGALLAGDAETGVSIMLMNAGMDTGDVLAQQPCPIGPGETAAGLTSRLAEYGARLLCDTIDRWVAGSITPTPQDDAQATYTALLTKNDGMIDWREPASIIAHKVRAYQPWPGCNTLWNGKRLSVLQAAVSPCSPPGIPGAVASPARGRAIVCTGLGGLELLAVQLEGRKPLGIRAFLAGATTFAGSVLTAPESTDFNNPGTARPN
ncbi:MAG: methionyl-tRNA formyltransferase [Dehalococcoidia bacterium]|nr:methionyl-tRNA formyltransferase [Dehalococcoidia bacterium]